MLRDVSFQNAVLEAADFRNVTFEGEAVFAGANFQHDTWFSRASFQNDAVFTEASFHGSAMFSRASFQGDAGFTGASFQGDAGFTGASFQRNARFGEARFQSIARFAGARFQGNAWFGGTQFLGGDIRFSEACFQRDAWFAEASFHGKVKFGEARFQNDAIFVGTSFQDDAGFAGARFQGNAWFAGASFRGDARFSGASFRRPLRTGPLLVAQTLSLNRIVFPGSVQLIIAARHMSCVGSTFSAGGHLRVSSAELTLAEAEIPAPLIISANPLPIDTARRWEELVGPQDVMRRPSLVSMQRANVAGLVLTGIDLRKCHFADAHHLDELKMIGADTFHRSGPRDMGRQVLAEECAWRRQRYPHQRRWQRTGELSDSNLLEDMRQPDQAELAGLYRQLRKGREDAKNEPGAADFYYGEMEMRRHNSDTPLGERFVLSLYWLTAGYGLRALRALVCLAVVVFVLAGLLHAVGFRPLHPVTPRSFWSSLLYTAESTLSLGNIDVRLTGWGRVLRIVLRLTGPVLLGLALLSVRNRVKR